MERSTERLIERWRANDVIDDATATRIRAWEREHATAQGSRFARFAFGFGGLLLGAGVLLFVAANWQELSPAARIATLAGSVALLHLLGALAASRSAALATTLHAVGTGAFGGAVFLAGQVFNLEESWPLGLLVWAVGAAVGLALRRDWPHAIWVAVLVPAWLVAEWMAALRFGIYAQAVPLVGLCLLGVAYVAAVGPGQGASWRRALARLGAIALVPVAMLMPFGRWLPSPGQVQPDALVPIGWITAIGLPLAVAGWLRGRAAWPLLVALVFAVLVTGLDYESSAQRLLAHVLYAAASAGLAAWGLRESHALRVNLGVLGFALSVLWFYYSSVFDRFGRSLGLVGLGVLFIGGGWWLESARRRLLGRIEAGER
jgi:uncharacterized membrane protein